MAHRLLDPPEIGAAQPSQTAERSPQVERCDALKALQALRDAGLIEWMGKSQNDPRAAWVIASYS